MPSRYYLRPYFDPCCGSGTIVRAAVDQKLLAEVDAADISKSVYASDQDPQAIQIATFALAKPSMMHEPVRIFQQDVFSLNPQSIIAFRNPSNGESFTEQLGTFEAIVSNLPFVAQNGRKQYENAMSHVKQMIGAGKKQFTKRADILAYIPFKLYPLLAENGRLGLIITNAWLGTEWGDHFYQHLIRYYRIKTVITSGAGRWFKNSDVVANVLILEKKEDEAILNGDINFVVLKMPIEELGEDHLLELVRAQIEIGRVHNDSMTLRTVSIEKLELFKKIGLGGVAQFVNCDWILDLPLVPVKSLFKVRRGERRGDNKLFYPTGNHGIEPEYIRPLAKDLKGFRYLVGQASKVAFCCAESEERLEELGHLGALNWIRRFKTPERIAKLGKGGRLWYSMDADRQSDMVMTINYNQRIFIPRLNPNAFADQRLVPFDPLENVDIDLCHALLNSSISMFIIEGMGFGRGLGVLDLNKDRIGDFMHILNPDILAPEAIVEIKDAFLPLLGREVMEIADELEQVDRQSFDDVVIRSFNIDVDRQVVYDSLLTLVQIRISALG